VNSDEKAIVVMWVAVYTLLIAAGVWSYTHKGNNDKEKRLGLIESRISFLEDTLRDLNGVVKAQTHFDQSVVFSLHDIKTDVNDLRGEFGKAEPEESQHKQ
jgi:uncharacterized coiled-coil protein SlyX